MVWHSSVTEKYAADLERVKKSAIKIILQDKYVGYQQGLVKLGIETLHSRRESLCLNFAIKCAKSDKMKQMFPENEKSHGMGTRNENKYKINHANTGRFQKSSIIYMQKLLNENELKIT